MAYRFNRLTGKLDYYQTEAPTFEPPVTIGTITTSAAEGLVMGASAGIPLGISFAQDVINDNYYLIKPPAAKTYLGIGYFHGTTHDWYPVSGTPAFTIGYDGKIGIGTIPSSYQVEIRLNGPGGINMLSGGATNIVSYILGRTSPESSLSVTGVAGQVFNDSAAGWTTLYSGGVLALGCAGAGYAQMAFDASYVYISRFPLLMSNVHPNSVYLLFGNNVTGAGYGDGLNQIFDAAGNFYIWNYENAFMRFGTNSLQRMEIASDGTITIGTSTSTCPQVVLNCPNYAAALLVKGSGTAVRIGNAATYCQIEGVDTTGVGSYKPLYIGGSSVYVTESGNRVCTINAGGLAVAPAYGITMEWAAENRFWHYYSADYKQGITFDGATRKITIFNTSLDIGGHIYLTPEPSLVAGVKITHTTGMLRLYPYVGAYGSMIQAMNAAEDAYQKLTIQASQMAVEVSSSGVSLVLNRVGVGTGAAQYWGLGVQNAAGSDFGIFGHSSSAYTTGGSLAWLGNAECFIYYPTTLKIATGAGSSPSMVLCSNGYVRVGGSSVAGADNPFQVVSTTEPQVSINYDGTYYMTISHRGVFNIADGANHYTFKSASVTQMEISTTGNMTVGSNVSYQVAMGINPCLTPTASGMADPRVMTLGNNYGTGTVGSNLKLVLWDHGTATNRYGFGISSALLEITGGSGADIGFFSGATQLMRLKTAGVSEIYAPLPASPYSGFTVFSSVATYYTAMAVGRTQPDLYMAIAGATGHYLNPGSTAGDGMIIVPRGGRLLLSTGAIGAAHYGMTINADNTINTTGSMSVSGSLSTMGSVTVTGSLRTTSTLSVSAGLGTSGNVNITGNLAVSGSCYGLSATPGASSVGQSQLKTSSSEVSHAFGSSEDIVETLPGGTYGFYPQVKRGGSGPFTAAINYGDPGTSYVTLIGFSGTSGVTAYAQQRYVTASDERMWLFILRDKSTKKIKSTWMASDHPCYGVDGKPELTPHPFRGVTITDEIVSIIIPKEDVEKILLNCEKEESKHDIGITESFFELYDVDEKESPWPTDPINVGLPKSMVVDGKKIAVDWRTMPSGTKVEPITKVIAQPADVINLSFKKK